ncbi:hypothetical protein SS1G_07100 [Sclerotinia sclerotiorum 1980 UF-70]|uniref:Erythromycin esterase n=2 Tax=Sclerotinia sclerotiorum (strain ATCC 18683 / 1980 / Ss-1) TaxID=665079 RepID=A7EP51_SCLS1|nr:hypothetical protein SS1G_07100 [Sclerotinia sclerotiorum 1980 UF-70]APA10413.1 hypothetical protein sscle_06g051830 [Sclerotinia sclerotiorum 1980 UF-70]EDO04617.1 hypothetical protein SS1G_07100 [Sclerotinia sclerotiorum 1980 UF-70]
MASPPRRRSSRLRTPVKTLPNPNTNTYLTSLAEVDEAPIYPSLPVVSSPVQTPQTPATSGRIVPPREEMHPSMTHKSTTQKPDSGLRHGFVDINAKGDDQPSGIQQKTPSKIGISSPTFDFKFARPAPHLGPEAQRMMDELREEALRIKAKLAAEREMERKKNPEGSHMGGRKIAQAKGKVNRYSDVHMAEFKKMDSIANHPSSFRAQPGRITPTAAIKRTRSKARLGDKDVTQSEDSSQDTGSDRPENTAPAKRARQRITDDASSQRPVSCGKSENIPMPSTPRHQISSFPAHLATPTQASMARAQSVKHPATQIPSLSRSPSKPNLQSTPRGMTKSATVNNIAGSMTAPSKSMLRTPSRFDRVKSILKHPGSSFSTKKTDKTSAIPSIARSPAKHNLAKDLPSVPTTPIGAGRSKSMKHVGFTPETRKHNEAKHNETTVPQSPSPVKSGIPRSSSKSNVKVGSSIAPRRPVPQEEPIKRQAKDAGMSETDAVEYPSLAGVRPLPEPPRQALPPHLPPSIPGTFTFRSDHTISFGASPKGFGPSPNQATVRQVRRSIFPDSMPGSFPDGNKENTDPPVRESSKKPTNLSVIPTVPHGMSNKKRRRVESDGEDEARSPKKQKAPEGAMLMAPRLQAGKNVTTSTPSPAKKRGLTLSRLNMLARPKARK